MTELSCEEIASALKLWQSLAGPLGEDQDPVTILALSIRAAEKRGREKAMPREMSWEEFCKCFPHRGLTPELREAASKYRETQDVRSSLKGFCVEGCRRDQGIRRG